MVGRKVPFHGISYNQKMEISAVKQKNKPDTDIVNQEEIMTIKY